MNSLGRIGIIYRKELVDALRDKRTLVAMLVVPIVLYPVIMLVVLQALQSERAKLERQRFHVAVPDRAHKLWLERLLARMGESDAPASEPAGRRGINARIDPGQFEIQVCRQDLQTCIKEFGFQLGLKLKPPPTGDETHPPNRQVELFVDRAEVPSNVAFDAMARILQRDGQRITDIRLRQHGLPNDVIQPFVVIENQVASPQKLGGSLLGQIMPFLLVIITITGAIYPAIDLTAGERERGTLETLMSAPVPVLQLVAGKFLVILTITLTVTLLNLGSMTATFQFGGLADAIRQAMHDDRGATSIPLQALPVVLMAMVPFAVLFSAIMLATCSFARTFKEAQNYMMPVMIAAMMPAMIVTYMPTLKLDAWLAVLPVANIVALIRQLFLGKYEFSAIVLVMGSTCLYAAAAVGIAARLYGKESVMFTDVGSYKSLLNRRFIRPAARPSAATALMVVAVIFPIQFYFQSGLVRIDPNNPEAAAGRFAVVMMACQILCYALPVIALTWYLRLDWRETLSLRRPAPAAMLGAILIAAGIVPVATWLGGYQARWFEGSAELRESAQLEQKLLLAGPLGLAVFAYGILPGICEELLFRGFLQGGLKSKLRPLTLCITVGLLFGIFHVYVQKIPVIAALGILLAFVCWRTGSIYPAMLIHAVNNGLSLAGAKIESLGVFLGQIVKEGKSAPPWVIPVAAACVIVGLLVIAANRPNREIRGAL